MWTVYLLQHSENKTFYVGVTSNLKQRITQHNSNSNYSTRRNTGTWILIYAEAYRVKKDAYAREAHLKKRGRAKQELLKRVSASIIAWNQKVVLGVVRRQLSIYGRKVTNETCRRICWNAEPQRVIVPYLKRFSLSCCRSWVIRDMNSLDESAGTNRQG